MSEADRRGDLEGTTPTRREAGYLAGCAAAIGAALGYALPAYAHLPNLYYDPIARRFLFGGRPGAIPMGYYGQLLYALAAAILCSAATYAIASRRRQPISVRAVGLAAAWALTALGLVAAYFTWNNWP